jgi:hypothetical protein
MSPKLERLDKYLLWGVCLTIVTVVVINFITSYGHIYSEGLRYGEYGTDARLMPVGIDGMLLAIGLANVFAARFERNHWLLRGALAFGVAGTVAANGAYGAGWGMTGGLLATWSPVALFIAVEAGLFMFRIAADIAAKAAEAAEAQTVPKRGRPVGSKNTPKTAPEFPVTDPNSTGAQPALPPVIKGRVDPMDPFHELRQTGQLPFTTDQVDNVSV